MAHWVSSSTSAAVRPWLWLRLPPYHAISRDCSVIIYDGDYLQLIFLFIIFLIFLPQRLFLFQFRLLSTPFPFFTR
jgi:hypothetical protein